MSSRLEIDADQPGWLHKICVEGLLFRHSTDPAAIPSHVFDSALVQWVDEGLVEHQSDDGWLVRWARLYDILEDSGYRSIVDALRLPKVVPVTPRLISQGALTDKVFRVAVREWIDLDTKAPVVLKSLVGAYFDSLERTGVIPRTCWSLLEAIQTLAQLPESTRSELEHRKAWGDPSARGICPGSNE